ELDDRIARHRAERPLGWETLEVGTDLVAALAATDAAEPVLIDGFTLWLSALIGDDAPPIDSILDGPLAAGLAAIHARPRPVVVVGEEIGSGIVPMHPGARASRDLVGIAHQRLAAMADEVTLLVAGLPLPLKGPPPR